MGYKGRVCMAVGRVLIAVTNVYNRIGMTLWIKVCLPVLYNKQPKPMFWEGRNFYPAYPTG